MSCHISLGGVQGCPGSGLGQSQVGSYRYRSLIEGLYTL